jgi:hypothetical protein
MHNRLNEKKIAECEKILKKRFLYKSVTGGEMVETKTKKSQKTISTQMFPKQPPSGRYFNLPEIAEIFPVKCKRGNPASD